jgi:glutaredoxin
VKEFLSQKNVGFTEHDVSQDRAAAKEMISRTGQKGVPVTVIDGEAIIGFDVARLEQALSKRPGESRTSFGAAIADNSKVSARQGAVVSFGAYIGRVRAGSAAQRVGLAVGDIVIEINMQRVANADDLERALSRLNQGSRISLVFQRGNKTFTTEGKL